MTETIASKAIGKWRKPGFLLEPLGWVRDRLTTAIEGEPGLIELLFNLDHTRMHIIALALAHLPSDVTPDFGLMLLKGSTKTILNLALGHHHPFWPQSSPRPLAAKGSRRRKLPQPRRVAH